MLGGVNYPNNSIIQFDSIYYTPDHCHSLLCTTDRVPCCSQPLSGNWYNVEPNGRFISVPNLSQNDYYQRRGNDGTIRLTQQGGATHSADSSYCCQLLDATSAMQTLCVTLSKLNKLNPQIAHLFIKFSQPSSFVLLFVAQHSPGVWLSLDGQFVPNNSAVELREVYETPESDDSSTHTLMCVTPKRPCCKTSPWRFGKWFYPNGSAVSIDGSGNSFYMDRGDDGTVHLHRRGITALSAAVGQFCCEIPNANNVSYRLYVHFSKLLYNIGLINYFF
jgi:hypothetical protein